MTNKAHNSKTFPEWEKLANKGKVKGVCVICHDESNNELQVMGIDGLTVEKLADLLETAAKTIRNFPIKKQK